MQIPASNSPVQSPIEDCVTLNVENGTLLYERLCRGLKNNLTRHSRLLFAR